ncbi:Histone acetyltransferase [Paramarasmius palmivorus]|uniref:Histone acetyltransferase n=1 Tax=Paramarasmius palmivorus TaxID=297713 RepID=A0AAW0CVE4_9AGAR
MQYGHLAPGLDRRDSTLDSNGSAPFQNHPILNQALGAHHLSNTAFQPRQDYRLSPGPTPSPIHAQQNGANHPSSSTSHFSLNSAQNGNTSPAMKRKLVDTSMSQAKRRREPDDMESFDPEGSGQGAKHWTDEEKSKLFSWLMGSGQDEHWSSLRSAKNSCLRECATEVFGGKKTYQALKGCFERNFNLFKQIYAFESFHAQQPSVLDMPDADRLREYEKRLQVARRAGCDVGNITARTIDHWHRVGWYGLFHQRWHGDPQTTKPTGSGRGGHPANGDDPDPEDESGGVDFTPDPLVGVSPRVTSHAPPPPPPNTNGIPSASSQDRTHHITSFINPQQTLSHSPTTHTTAMNGIQSSTTAIPNLPKTSIPTPTPTLPTVPNTPLVSSPQTQTTGAGTSDSSPVNITLTQGMINSYLQFLQIQTQTGKMKLEYLRRREEREELESAQRREIERLRAEREAQEYEHNKQTAMIKQKTDKAIELLSNPNVDASVKHSAGEFLKKLFSEN